MNRQERGRIGGIKSAKIQAIRVEKDIQKFKELYDPSTMTFPDIAKIMNKTESTCMRYAKKLGYPHKPRGYKAINDGRKAQKAKHKAEFTTYWKQGLEVKEIAKIMGISKETGFLYQRELREETSKK